MKMKQLQPERVFYYFEQISNIPRPSYQEKAISDYLVSFAKAHHLEVYQDALFNVVIIKEASEGYEDKEPIILQGHMDMVCEKADGCTKDMEKEGLDLAIEGDYLYAEGTTLGGDDGIAVAYALALLEDDTFKHPRLEVIITVSEEVGMDGARGIELSMIKGHTLLNLDSEEEGIALAGCAGGGSARISLPMEFENKTGISALIQVSGLAGGHSGVEIHKGHPNATHLLAAVLSEIADDCDASLASIEGGSKDNAIPRSAQAQLIIAPTDIDKVQQIVRDYQKDFGAEYAVIDPDLKVSVTFEEDITAKAADTHALKQAVGLIMSEPNGVQSMSKSIEGLVETSLNLGITKIEEESLKLGYSLRSSVGSAYRALRAKVIRIAECFGAEVTLSGEYPAWEYVAESPLRDRMCDLYQEMFGKEMKVDVIHAGVECGLLAGKISNLDAVSIGPDILDIHTPQERLSISSTARCYAFIRELIETL